MGGLAGSLLDVSPGTVRELCSQDHCYLWYPRHHPRVPVNQSKQKVKKNVSFRDLARGWLGSYQGEPVWKR